MNVLQISCNSSITNFANAYELITLTSNKFNAKGRILKSTKLAVVEATKLHTRLEKYKKRKEKWQDQDDLNTHVECMTEQVSY